MFRSTMMKYALHTLIICFFVIYYSSKVSFAQQQVSSYADLSALFSDPKVHYIELNRPNSTSIQKNTKRLLISSGGVLVDFDNFTAFSFLPNLTQQYLLEFQSDLVGVAVFILDDSGKVIDVPKVQRPPLINKTTIKLYENQKVWMIFASYDVPAEAIIRFGLFSANSPGLGPNRDRSYDRLNVGKSNFKIIDRSSESEYPSKFFKPDQIRPGHWSKIKVTTSHISPLLQILDSNDQVINQLYRDERARSSSVTIDPQTNWSTLVVEQLDQDVNSAGEDFSIDYEQTPYDPGNLPIGLLNFYLSNPLVTFLAGGILAVFISYVFYLKSVRSKVILYETEQDRLLIDSRENVEPLLFGPEKKPLFCASMFVVLISRSGNGHISSDDILKPLTLSLENVKSIVTFHFETSQDSWRQPIKSEAHPNELQLPFSNLAKEDYLRLSILCEQDLVSSIVATLSGRIKDGLIKKRHINPRRSWPYILGLLVGGVVGGTAAYIQHRIDQFFDLEVYGSILSLMLVFSVALILVFGGLKAIAKILRRYKRLMRN